MEPGPAMPRGSGGASVEAASASLAAQCGGRALLSGFTELFTKLVERLRGGHVVRAAPESGQRWPSVPRPQLPPCLRAHGGGGTDGVGSPRSCVILRLPPVVTAGTAGGAGVRWQGVCHVSD